MSEYKFNKIDKDESPYCERIPYSTSIRNFQVGKVVLTLLTLAVSSPSTNVEARTMTNYTPYDIPYHDSDNVNKKIIAKSLMLVPKSFLGKTTMEQENEIMLYKSFSDSCKKYISSEITLSPVFNFLVKGLKELSFKKTYVDVIPSKGMIDINLNLGHMILLSVSKSLSSISDEYVNFSISVNGEIRTISKMPSLELIQKVKEIQRKLSE